MNNNAVRTIPSEKRFLKVDEVSELLEVSHSTAYKIMRKLNKELEAQGKIVLAGRISKKYLLDRYSY